MARRAAPTPARSLGRCRALPPPCDTGHDPRLPLSLPRRSSMCCTLAVPMSPRWAGKGGRLGWVEAAGLGCMPLLLCACLSRAPGTRGVWLLWHAFCTARHACSLGG